MWKNRTESKIRFVAMKIDKIIFDTFQKKFLLILKDTDKNQNNRTAVISIDALESGNPFIFNFYMQTDTLPRVIDQLGYRIESLRILNRGSGNDAAEAVLKRGFGSKTVKLSLVDAIALAEKSKASVQVAENLVKPYRMDIKDESISTDEHLRTLLSSEEYKEIFFDEGIM